MYPTTKKYIPIENGHSNTAEFKRTLRNFLEKYNRFLSENTVTFNEYNLDIYPKSFIPNNNNKFYCLIYNNFLYFFSIIDRKISNDFYIRVKNVFSENLLIEGYLYDKDYKISDILVTDYPPLQDYRERYKQICDFFNPKLGLLKNLNNRITFSITEYVETTESLPQYAKMDYIEVIQGLNKRNKQVHFYDFNPIDKIIKKGLQSDVYLVHDNITLEYQGLLYVRTMMDSLNILKLFTDKEEISLKCIFNEKFLKWTWDMDN